MSTFILACNQSDEGTDVVLSWLVTSQMKGQIVVLSWLVTSQMKGQMLL